MPWKRVFKFFCERTIFISFFWNLIRTQFDFTFAIDVKLKAHWTSFNMNLVISSSHCKSLIFVVILLSICVGKSLGSTNWLTGVNFTVSWTHLPFSIERAHARNWRLKMYEKSHWQIKSWKSSKIKNLLENLTPSFIEYTICGVLHLRKGMQATFSFQNGCHPKVYYRPMAPNL